MRSQRIFLIVIATGFIVFTSGRLRSEIVVLPNGAKTEWRFKDDGLVPEKEWLNQGFDDSDWKQGKAPLGYGEPDLNSELSFGPRDDSKHITSYFRTRFVVKPEQRKQLDKLGLSLRRDDGAVVYLNGKEIARSNLPAGNITSKTLALSALGSGTEEQFHEYFAPASLLSTDPENTIAVEVHQAHPSSSDLYLDLEIKGFRADEVPARDVFREGSEALRQRDYAKAAELLAQVPPDHPAYARTMAFLAHRIYCDTFDRPAEGLSFAKKAYAAAPQDRSVVQAYLRTYVLSGELFDDEDIRRERRSEIADEHQFLITKPSLGDSPTLGRRQLEDDLDYLEHILANCFAYLEIREVDYRGALDAIRNSLDDETSLKQFELQIAKLISLFCDGHAGLTTPPSQYLTDGYAPYVAGHYQDRIYLCDPQERGFIDPDHPYVTAIDGRPIAEWLKVAGYTVVKESSQWHRLNSLGNLRFVNYIRSELGLERKPTLLLQLESENRKAKRELTVRVQSKLPERSSRNYGRSRRIEEIGYLRIPQMTSSAFFLNGLDGWMSEFKDTEGLIIDIRDNSGGSKQVLFRLFPYFMKPNDPMRVLEMSVFRKPFELPMPRNGFMRSDTSGQPLTSSRWKDDAQRRHIADFIDTYKTEWALPKGKFSQWHVMAIGASDNSQAYFYDKPLIILQNSRTFSAGDIFLGAFEDHPNTTLMGEPSGGGNGWMEAFTLPNSGVRLILCQSAKFRPNGKLYDGEGIRPDIVLQTTPDDVFGKSDTVLDAAVERLTKSVQ